MQRVEKQRSSMAIDREAPWWERRSEDLLRLGYEGVNTLPKVCGSKLKATVNMEGS